MRTKRIVLIVITTLVVGVATAACSGSDRGDGATSGDTAQVEAEQGAIVDAQGNVIGRSGGGGGSDTGEIASGTSEGFGNAPMAGDQNGGGPEARSSLPDTGPSVIKTALLELEVGKEAFRDALRDGIAVAERYGGYVLTTSVEDESEGRGSIVLRVPATSFGRALTDLEDLGDVKHEVVSGQDVGQEFVDLQARLRNYAAQEAVLLKLMERAESVTDTIRVQGELQGVQLEIERLRGRIRYLEDQTSMGTIEVRFAEVFATPERLGEFGKAWERAKDGFVAVIAAVIASLGVLVPLAFLVALVVVLVARLRPRFTS